MFPFRCHFTKDFPLSSPESPAAFFPVSAEAQQLETSQSDVLTGVQSRGHRSGADHAGPYLSDQQLGFYGDIMGISWGKSMKIDVYNCIHMPSGTLHF